ncbi:hypothetical protein AB0O47_38845 [Streptomyces noursei]|uniref:hypothetical protein n=1 Tax=Streptomyces noursei TaxID=1971 RepID=UPI00344F87F9
MPVENMTALTFDRTLNDVATASITITKASLDDACCGQLGDIEPWLHELSIYRDSELVWQGPVMTVTETRDTVVIEAWDISAWIGRIVNFSTKEFKPGEQDVSMIARYYVDWNLLTSSYACKHNAVWPDGKTRATDHACITPYIWRQDVGVKPAYKPQEDTKYVINILEELVKSGLYWTTVGRRLILKGKPTEKDLPIATLTTDDLMGDFSIVRDGQAFATRAVATNSSSEEDRQTVTTGRGCNNPYGRVDWLVSSTDVPQCTCEEDGCLRPDNGRCRGNADCGPCTWSSNRQAWNCDTPQNRQAACNACIRECLDVCKTACQQAQRDALLAIAKSELQGRYPVPISIAIDNGAALHPDAPVCFEELVPGFRFDVRLDRACRRIEQAFVLANVSVTWDTGGEKVSIGLTPLDAPGRDENQGPALADRAAMARAAGNTAAATWWESGEIPAPPETAVEFAERAAR